MANEYNRENMIQAIKEHAKGHIAKHAMNVEVYLKNSAGIGEHPDILESIEKELAIIAQYHDQLEVIEKESIIAFFGGFEQRFHSDNFSFLLMAAQVFSKHLARTYYSIV